MRFAVLAAAAMMAASALVPSPRQAEPFVPMAVDYAVDPLTSPSTTAGDLQSIRNLGFNTIATVVRWRDAEPAPGKYSFAALERTLAAAEQAGLRVQVTLDNTAPDWLFDRYPDGRRVTGTQTPASPPENAACFDHPAVRAALQAFLESASRIVRRSPAFFAIDAGSPTPVGFCLCRNTARRFAASAKESGLDHDAFVRTSLRDDLKWMISQTAPSYARIVGAHSRVPSLLQRTLAAYPSQDDWLMSPLVDRYGVVLDEAPRNPAAIAMAFDGLAGAAGGRGWSLRTRPSVRSDDLRFLTWLAFSRGARSAAYGDLPSDSAFVKVVTRNPALFAELRPVPAAVAILYDPRSGAAAEESLASVYEALFRRNIAADFLHTGELSLAAMKRHRVLVVPGATAASAAAALKEFSSAGGLVIHLDERTPFDDAMVARLSKAGAAPEARVGGGDGLVETRFLQSARVLMLIALNHSTRPARVTLTFKPETQEAIWQNMETGAGVNFIAGPDGPTYTYFFRPRDALVLMIRTDIR